jgi:transcriptional regulator with XRE-family HTH domain
MKIHPLRAEREGRGWSQAKIAKALGISTRTVSRWEQGLAVPHPYYREQLSSLFSKTLEELGLLPDADENDALEEVSSSLAESEVPDSMEPMPFLVDPSIPQALRGGNSLDGRDDISWPQSLWDDGLGPMESTSRSRPLKHFSWHSLLMVSILSSLCVLVIIVLLVFNKLPFPSGITPTTDLRITYMTIIDDSIQGNGPNQFHYVGNGWGHCAPHHFACGARDSSTLYNLSNSWDTITNDYVTLSFTGVQIRFYGVLDPKHGIGAVSLDGGPETMIDFYAARRAGNQLLWTSPMLPAGTHTFKLRVTGTANAGASGAFVAIDRVDLLS